MSYRVLAFDPNMGILHLAFEGLVGQLEVPIIDGKWATGADLEAAIAAITPTSKLERMALIKATPPSNPEELHAIVDKPVLTPEQELAKIQEGMMGYVQLFMDRTAQAYGYDNMISACSYAAAPNKFQAESLSFLQWRSDVWEYCNEVVAQVKAQTRPVPTAEALLLELPAYVPPVAAPATP